MLSTWRLKLLGDDDDVEGSRQFSDLRTPLKMMRPIAAARPGLMLVISVPPNAPEEDRERVRQMSRSHIVGTPRDPASGFLAHRSWR
jgi:hypothetical protein